MRIVNAPEGNGELTALLEQVGSEPVMIRRKDHDVAVVLSVEEFNRMRPDWEEFDAFCARISAEAQANGLTEDTLHQILTEIDAER